MAARRPIGPADAAPDPSRHHDALVVVYELIAAHGIDGTTMRQVAAAAGLSTGTLNYHFTNKRGLILAALDHAYRLPRDWHRYEGSAIARLRRLARNYTVDRPQLANWWRFWMEVTAHAARDAELRRHQQDLYRGLVDFIADVITDGMTSRELRSGLDARAEATRLVDLGYGVVMHQLLDPTSAATATRVLTDAIEQLR